MATGYASFVRTNSRFLGFGLVMAASSSFGQTFFISIFGGQFRAEFGLSHGAFGSVYSIATLGSAFTIIWAGRLIDRYDLKAFSLAVCALMAVACAFASTVQGVVMLGLAIYALRLSGQGLFSLTAITSMARYFEADRGKALSISNLGFPLGEGLFPLVGVSLIAALGWRGAWLAVAVAVALILPPMVIWLLKGHAARDRKLREARPDAGRQAALGRTDWTRGEVLRDPRFYLLLLALLSLSFIGTGIIFHHVYLVETKGWSITWFASTFIGSAAASVVASIAIGPLIDRHTACRLYPLTLVSAGLALLILASFDHPATALAYMILYGFSNGMNRGAMGAIWAELYGVRHLGAIRGVVSATTALGTALSPFSMGLMIDAGVSMEALVIGCLVYLVIAIGRARLALRDGAPRPPRP